MILVHPIGSGTHSIIYAKTKQAGPISNKDIL
jgi:hypothetical protein